MFKTFTTGNMLYQYKRRLFRVGLKTETKQALFISSLQFIFTLTTLFQSYDNPAPIVYTSQTSKIMH